MYISVKSFCKHFSVDVQISYFFKKQWYRHCIEPEMIVKKILIVRGRSLQPHFCSCSVLYAIVLYIVPGTTAIRKVYTSFEICSFLTFLKKSFLFKVLDGSERSSQLVLDICIKQSPFHPTNLKISALISPYVEGNVKQLIVFMDLSSIFIIGMLVNVLDADWTFKKNQV